MKRLFLESAVVALVVWGGWRWTHPPTEAPTPTFDGTRPTLDMPAAPTLRPARPGDAMRVKPGDIGGEERLGVRERPLGSTPRLISSGAPPDTQSPTPRSGAPTWDERLRDPRALGVVFAAFLLFWLLLGRALRRGPGGKGLTND
jgi:hypothetical protein